jgi:hypothetical protein
MTLRTRLKRLEKWAKGAAPFDNERPQREAMQQKLDGLPLEVLLVLEEALAKQTRSECPVEDLDLPVELHQQLKAYLSGQHVPSGWGTWPQTIEVPSSSRPSEP